MGSGTVQLNPGGVLNHKYAGEWAVRGARVPYAVVRSTGVALTPRFNVAGSITYVLSNY